MSPPLDAQPFPACRLDHHGLAWGLFLAACVVLGLPETPITQAAPAPLLPSSDNLTYSNDRKPEVPLSIHVVRWPRGNPAYELHSLHAGNAAVGMATLSAQVGSLQPSKGTPLAAINADFYQPYRAYAGHPRGIQILDGEVISAPSGGVSFWIDAFGQPHTSNIVSRFSVIWPDGSSNHFGLNEERRATNLVLYTSAVGPSTHTVGGRELVLERSGTNLWLPLRMSETYTARVREQNDAGDTAVSRDTMVLSIGPGLVAKLPAVPVGGSLLIWTASTPNLWSSPVAIGGGPVLIHGGRPQKIDTHGSEAYEFGTMLEPHPRSAIGWNRQYFFLVVVDGRQKNLSVGMTLEELSNYLVSLGCEEAMNFDGGGSATLWAQGQVRNSPCDRRERVIANGLVVLEKPRPGANSAGSVSP